MKEKNFIYIFTILLLSAIFTIIIPGAISYLAGSFYKENIENIILSDTSACDSCSNFKEEALKLKHFSTDTSNLSKQIETINVRLYNFYPYSDFASQQNTYKNLINYRNNLLNEQHNLKPPFIMIPFFGSPQTTLWFGIYSTILILIYRLSKIPVNEINSKTLINVLTSKLRKLFLLSFLIYAFFEWPAYLRIFTGSHERIVYAYPNWDIDKYSFVYQELRTFFFCFFSGWLICIAIKDYNTKLIIEKQAANVNKFLIISSHFSTAYKSWLNNSLILAMGFLLFTNLYWRLVSGLGDDRYILSAVNAHVIWAVCWVAISLTPLRYLSLFEETKREILMNKTDDNTIKILLEHQPSNYITALISGIISILTFLSPIIKTFIFR